MMESVNAKGVGYIKKVPSKFLKLLFRFDIAVLLFWILGALILNLEFDYGTKNMILSFPFKDESTVRRLCANLTECGAAIEIRNVDYSNECSMNIVCQKEFYETFVKKVTDTLAGCVTVEKKDETTMLIKE